MEIFELTRSKLRRELLKYYFLHPQGRYYLRELERLLKLPVGNIRRELLKMSRMGLFSPERVGNLVYYSLNRECPFYDEIRSIVLKTAGMKDVFHRELQKLEGLEIAFIYGSFADGSEVKGSDIDLFLVGDLDQYKLVRIVHKIEDQIGRTVNYVFFTKKELKDRISKKNHFILNVLNNKKIMVLGDENEL